MRPWIAVAYSAPVAAASAVFLVYPIGQGSFSDGMPLGKLICPTCTLIAPLVLLRPEQSSGCHSALMSIMERSETCLNRESPTSLKPEHSSGCLTAEANLFDLFKPFFALLLQSLCCHSATDDSSFDAPQSGKVTRVGTPFFVGGNPVLNRLKPRKKPGLYMIRCDVNDKRYYGESSNVSGRLNSHRSLLKQGIHPCRTLQADWDRYGEEKFDFVPLYMGQTWTERKTRIEKETFLINSDRPLCYNVSTGLGRSGEDNGFFGRKHSNETKETIGGAQRGVPKDKLGRTILLDGQVYPSIAEASRVTNHARKTIRAWLNDPTNTRCVKVS